MDWVHTKRRGPQWKQGWTDQTLGSMSAPPLPLVAIFGIVIFLLSLSQYSTYKEQIRYTAINLKLFIYVVPIFLIFFMRSSLLKEGGLSFWSSSPRGGRHVRRELGRGMSGFPWGVAVLVVLLLVLVSYQSVFHSKWFFGSSD